MKFVDWFHPVILLFIIVTSAESSHGRYFQHISQRASMIHCLSLFLGLFFCSLCVVILWACYQSPGAKLIPNVSSAKPAEGWRIDGS